MTVLTIGMALVVSTVAQAQPGIDRSSDLANTLTDIGISAPVATSAALTYLGNEHQERAGRQAGDALLVTSLATQGLKRLFRRPRPSDPSAQDGFPSGHASISFAFARAISEHYDDWGKVAYLFAGGVAWSRVRRDEHSVKQVLAGAALGWYIADRSISSRGGLLDGLVVNESPPAFAASYSEKMRAPVWQLWRADW